jgi:glyoxylase-like metal-dependent hydrolase (beta-lactamase superfamily II)
MSHAPARIDLGGLVLTILDGGTFRLDGASLYGVLPRVFWEKLNHPDEDNRVLLSVAPAVVETPEGTVVIDPGIGSEWGPAAVDRYDLRGQRALPELLAEAGVDPDGVSGVILTHLHFDHAWGAVERPGSSAGRSPRQWVEDLAGEVEPALPAARLYVQAGEIDYVRRPDLRTASHVVPAVAEAYERAGRLVRLDGDTEPVPGVRLVRTGGHTPGHQVVWLEGSAETFLLAGDLVPTTTHLRGEVEEGLDVAPARSAAVKAGLLARVVEKSAYLTFYHAPRVRWGRIRPGPSGAYSLDETYTVKTVTRRSPRRGKNGQPEETDP